jgi:hypothetical protein
MLEKLQEVIDYFHDVKVKDNGNDEALEDILIPFISAANDLAEYLERSKETATKEVKEELNRQYHKLRRVAPDRTNLLDDLEDVINAL